MLPRGIATFEAFENAMTLDIAMGGSTNTVLHLLAIAREAEVNFTMKDMDRLSRHVPTLCKVAPSSEYHLEDVHRAGGIAAILGELDRAGLLHGEVSTVHSKTLRDGLKQWDIAQTQNEEVKKFFRAAPGGIITTIAFSQSMLYPDLDTDRAQGCIRDKAHAYSKDGGLAVLHGNIALDGCIVKTAGVDESILKFSGRARLFESQDAAIGRHSGRPDRRGRCGGDPLRRTERRAGHAGDAVSDFVPEVERHWARYVRCLPTGVFRAARPV